MRSLAARSAAACMRARQVRWRATPWLSLWPCLWVWILSPTAAAQSHSGRWPTAAARYFVWPDERALPSLALLAADATRKAEEPRAVELRVLPGQTLSQIARAHGCTVEALRALNGIADPSRLQEGARLRLPSTATVSHHEPDSPRDAEAGWVNFVGASGLERVRLVDSNGVVLADGLAALERLMNLPRLPNVRSAHPRLALLLANISHHFGGRPLRIVSGYRAPRRFTHVTSRHTVGRATDIQVLGVSHRRVWEYCKSLSFTGCGFYPNSVFVHVDVRRDNAQWVDWSRPDERPRYGTLKRPYREDEALSASRPRVPRVVTRPDAVPLAVRVATAAGNTVRLVNERPGARELAELAEQLLQGPL